MTFHYQVDGNDFTLAGENSSKVKKHLKQLGLPPEVIRRVAIAMYEAEINMVIHANGGTIDVEISPQEIHIVFADTGPGIPDIEKAMQEGYSTASNEVRELGFGAGMGLPNIKKNSDEMKIDTKVGVGTTIDLIIRIA
ncbi:ATP-binding protein [Ructibacterium gallinarum]|uniref:ATP-binding protein n=1 Tax=Ructibacterium gallinarum TaxID=2779355 RepID=A0A9D5R8I1_9FIRM|nr:ATP-binding protein [Ructibacterium gallinarum]MBE5039987.1 ATP-binding protein [Ructibacterium gallinarum]